MKVLPITKQNMHKNEKSIFCIMITSIVLSFELLFPKSNGYIIP
ncbi:hypothetical protein BCE_3350 [Bacillus cereus ATCC 10987]|uniref:Uncharacterized protein n=1 Tax=Bacillus cereus (strain ATCC 10987 / NRS 248) TaxID=222523 RepID=Q734Q4_BACC1|nr:hypothetical protein BCE_3350 [Bacillus cereus ATCC 10987]